MLNIYKTEQMKDFLDEDEFNPNYKYHNMELKHILISAPTGAGKSNWLINYILVMNNTFEHIYIFSKAPSCDPLYMMLKEKLGDSLTLETVDKVVPLSQIKKYDQSLIIFDDFITSSKATQQILDNYAIMSRKYHFQCIYLTQAYFSVSQKLRQNCKYLVLLSLTNKRNKDLIISQLSIDIKKQTINKIIGNATKLKLNSCIIDLLSMDEPNKIFRRNFSEFYDIMDENNEELQSIKLYTKNGIIN